MTKAQNLIYCFAIHYKTPYMQSAVCQFACFFISFNSMKMVVDGCHTKMHALVVNCTALSVHDQDNKMWGNGKLKAFVQKGVYSILGRILFFAGSS